MSHGEDILLEAWLIFFILTSTFFYCSHVILHGYQLLVMNDIKNHFILSLYILLKAWKIARYVNILLV